MLCAITTGKYHASIVCNSPGPVSKVWIMILDLRWNANPPQETAKASLLEIYSGYCLGIRTLARDSTWLLLLGDADTQYLGSISSGIS